MAIQHIRFFYLDGVWDDRKFTRAIRIPEACSGYQWFERRVHTGFQGTKTLGERTNFSPCVWFGYTYTLEELKKHLPDDKTLIAHMESCKCLLAVKNAQGKIFALRGKDIAIQERHFLMPEDIRDTYEKMRAPKHRSLKKLARQRLWKE